MELWPLCQTLSHRNDLAARIHVLELLVLGRIIDIRLPSTLVLPGEVTFATTFNVKKDETAIAGTLLQRLPNLEVLNLIVARNVPPRYANPSTDEKVSPFSQIVSARPNWHFSR